MSTPATQTVSIAFKPLTGVDEEVGQRIARHEHDQRPDNTEPSQQHAHDDLVHGYTLGDRPSTSDSRYARHAGMRLATTPAPTISSVNCHSAELGAEAASKMP